MYRLVVFLFSTLIFCSCENEKPAPYVMPREMMKEVDSLFLNQKDSLLIMTDSICDTRYEAIYRQAKDSIKTKRLSEIEDIIDE